MKAGNQNALESVEEYYPKVVGVDLTPTGVEQVEATASPTRTVYYDATGRQVSAGHGGLVIECITHANGQTTTRKYVNH